MLLIVLMATARVTSASTLVQMRTDMGDIDIVLFEELAPVTVQNFLDYMNKGTTGGYDGTYIYRSIAGFVVQGGGYIFDPDDGDFVSGGISHIPEDAPIANEAGLPGALSNVRGTLAMAKQAGDPDSAKSEWFFNHVNNNDPTNPDNLDQQNGGFTVFGANTSPSQSRK
jgi:cyclophilin family peptidyl-prolyl cis-trans isomerase